MDTFLCPGFISPFWYSMSMKFQKLVLLIVDKSVGIFSLKELIKMMRREGLKDQHTNMICVDSICA